MTKAETLNAINELTDNAFADFDIDTVKADVLDRAHGEAAAFDGEPEKAAEAAAFVINTALGLNPPDDEPTPSGNADPLVYVGPDAPIGRLSHKGMFYERGAANAVPMSREDFDVLADMYGLIEVK